MLIHQGERSKTANSEFFDIFSFMLVPVIRNPMRGAEVHVSSDAPRRHKPLHVDHVGLLGLQAARFLVATII